MVTEKPCLRKEKKGEVRREEGRGGEGRGGEGRGRGRGGC